MVKDCIYYSFTMPSAQREQPPGALHFGGLCAASITEMVHHSGREATRNASRCQLHRGRSDHRRPV